MQSFADYRKGLIRESLEHADLFDNIDRRFGLLKIDLLEALRLPKTLSESYVGDAATILEGVIEEDYLDNKAAIEDVLEQAQQLLHWHVFNEAGLLGAEPADVAKLAGIDKLKAQINWALRSFIDNIKRSVEQHLVANRAPVTAAAQQPAAQTGGAPAGGSPPPYTPGSGGVSSPWHQRGTAAAPAAPAAPGGASAPGKSWYDKKSTGWHRFITNPIKTGAKFIHKLTRGDYLDDHTRREICNLLESLFVENEADIMKVIDDFGKELTSYIMTNVDAYVRGVASKPPVAPTAGAPAPTPTSPGAPVPGAPPAGGAAPAAAASAASAAVPGAAPVDPMAPEAAKRGAPVLDPNKFKERLMKGEYLYPFQVQNLYGLAGLEELPESPDRRLKQYNALRKMHGAEPLTEYPAKPSKRLLTDEEAAELRGWKEDDYLNLMMKRGGIKRLRRIARAIRVHPVPLIGTLENHHDLAVDLAKRTFAAVQQDPGILDRVASGADGTPPNAAPAGGAAAPAAAAAAAVPSAAPAAPVAAEKPVLTAASAAEKAATHAAAAAAPPKDDPSIMKPSPPPGVGVADDVSSLPQGEIPKVRFDNLVAHLTKTNPESLQNGGRKRLWEICNKESDNKKILDLFLGQAPEAAPAASGATEAPTPEAPKPAAPVSSNPADRFANFLSKLKAKRPDITFRPEDKQRVDRLMTKITNDDDLVDSYLAGMPPEAPKPAAPAAAPEVKPEAPAARDPEVSAAPARPEAPAAAAPAPEPKPVKTSSGLGGHITSLRDRVAAAKTTPPATATATAVEEPPAEPEAAASEEPEMSPEEEALRMRAAVHGIDHDLPLDQLRAELDKKTGTPARPMAPPAPEPPASAPEAKAPEADPAIDAMMAKIPDEVRQGYSPDDVRSLLKDVMSKNPNPEKSLDQAIGIMNKLRPIMTGVKEEVRALAAPGELLPLLNNIMNPRLGKAPTLDQGLIKLENHLVKKKIEPIVNDIFAELKSRGMLDSYVKSFGNPALARSEMIGRFLHSAREAGQLMPSPAMIDKIRQEVLQDVQPAAPADAAEVAPPEKDFFQRGKVDDDGDAPAPVEDAETRAQIAQDEDPNASRNPFDQVTINLQNASFDDAPGENMYKFLQRHFKSPESVLANVILAADGDPERATEMLKEKIIEKKSELGPAAFQKPREVEIQQDPNAVHSPDQELAQNLKGEMIDAQKGLTYDEFVREHLGGTKVLRNYIKKALKASGGNAQEALEALMAMLDKKYNTWLKSHDDFEEVPDDEDDDGPAPEELEGERDDGYDTSGRLGDQRPYDARVG